MAPTIYHLIPLFKASAIVKILGSGEKKVIKIVDRHGTLMEIGYGNGKVVVYLRNDYYAKIEEEVRKNEA